MYDDIKQLFELLRHSGFEICEFTFAAPYCKVPANVAGIPVPSFLRGIYENHIGRICYRYWRELSKPERQRFGSSFNSNTLYGGPELIGADELANARHKAEEFARDSWLADDENEAAIWMSAVPFMETNGGDYLAFNSSGQVVYLCHDAESFTLAISFENFWSVWRNVYFVGPEYWMLDPFLSSNKLLDSSSANIVQFSAAFKSLLKGA